MASWVICQIKCSDCFFVRWWFRPTHVRDSAEMVRKSTNKRWNEGLEVVFFVSLKNG